jgi:hypothetical protein
MALLNRAKSYSWRPRNRKSSPYSTAVTADTYAENHGAHAGAQPQHKPLSISTPLRVGQVAALSKSRVAEEH